jgi:hypothetical protein
MRLRDLAELQDLRSPELLHHDRSAHDRDNARAVAAFPWVCRTVASTRPEQRVRCDTTLLRTTTYRQGRTMRNGFPWAALAVALGAIGTASCAPTPGIEHGCPQYVVYPSTQAAADASDLVASARLDVLENPTTTEQKLVQFSLDEVRKGDAGLTQTVVRVPIDVSCGDPAPTAKPNGPGPDVIVFLVGSSDAGWRLLTPVQGVAPFSEGDFDAIQP